MTLQSEKSSEEAAETVRACTLITVQLVITDRPLILAEVQSGYGFDPVSTLGCESCATLKQWLDDDSVSSLSSHCKENNRSSVRYVYKKPLVRLPAWSLSSKLD